jgi:putative transposase
MCAWLHVSKSGFHEWRGRPASATAERRENLKGLIVDIFEESDETYGYRRVHAALARRGVQARPELVCQLMRELGLVPCRLRPWRPATTVAGDAGVIPDLVARDFDAAEPGVKVVGDIAYIKTWDGWLYLATVVDCCAKEVVGCAMADHMRAASVTAAPDMAARNHAHALGAVFHSDRGSQYVSEGFAGKARRLNISRSVGRTGVCWGNTMAESFNAALKVERPLHRLSHSRARLQGHCMLHRIPLQSKAPPPGTR